MRLFMACVLAGMMFSATSHAQTEVLRGASTDSRAAAKPTAKQTAAPSPGTLPTNGVTFAVVLLGAILIIAALTFFPALCLGPIVEHGLMLSGRTF